MLQVVWLKRDLRVEDHRPLIEAAAAGPVLVIYAAEPSIWCAGDLSRRHLRFVAQSLADVDTSLRERGGLLLTAVAELEPVLESLYRVFGPFRLLAHEENGAPNTFARDLRVHRWMRERSLTFTEYQHFGVTRRLKDRSQFQPLWQQFMSEPLLAAPERLSSPPHEQIVLLLAEGVLQRGVQVESLADAVPGEWLLQGQAGGERLGRAVLTEFLQERYARYQSHISKPYESTRSCGRISAHLAWGNLSMRQVVQQTWVALASAPPAGRRHLEAFLSRLHWHCHFIQRIEDEPRLAEQTMNPAFEGIRGVDEERFQAWLVGKTGFPAVDAAMRSLWQTGWLHFRGRAMVVSFVCNTLLLDWRQPAQALAQLFLDYEPGIHYSQVQMQAGTTGFNTIRIYNPVKQSEEHDPYGRFIKMFIPELRAVSPERIHQPWLDEALLMKTGYPAPMVDLAEANRRARDLLWGVRKGLRGDEATRSLLQKHGSRANAGTSRAKKKAQSDDAPEQLSFDF